MVLFALVSTMTVAEAGYTEVSRRSVAACKPGRRRVSARTRDGTCTPRSTTAWATPVDWTSSLRRPPRGEGDWPLHHGMVTSRPTSISSGSRSKIGLSLPPPTGQRSSGSPSWPPSRRRGSRRWRYRWPCGWRCGDASVRFDARVRSVSACETPRSSPSLSAHSWRSRPSMPWSSDAGRWSSPMRSMFAARSGPRACRCLSSTAAQRSRLKTAPPRTVYCFCQTAERAGFMQTSCSPRIPHNPLATLADAQY